MGARGDLLEAARRLTARGTVVFSPVELISEARLNGSTYPESTLRTLIVSQMCANAPSNHATRHSDFERLSRAEYRLARTGMTASPAPPNEANPTQTSRGTSSGIWVTEYQPRATRRSTIASTTSSRITRTPASTSYCRPTTPDLVSASRVLPRELGDASRLVRSAPTKREVLRASCRGNRLRSTRPVED